MVKYWVKLQYIIVEGKTHKMNQVIRTMDSFIEHGQARKSVRGMPWHQEPTKDVAIYDKPR